MSSALTLIISSHMLLLSLLDDEKDEGEDELIDPPLYSDFNHSFTSDF